VYWQVIVVVVTADPVGCPGCTSGLENGQHPDALVPESAVSTGGHVQGASACAEVAEHSQDEFSCSCTCSTSMRGFEKGMGKSGGVSTRRQLREDLGRGLWWAKFQQQLANTSSKQVGGRWLGERGSSNWKSFPCVHLIAVGCHASQVRALPCTVLD